MSETKRTEAPMNVKERLTSLFLPAKGMEMYRRRMEENERARKTASASGYHYHGASKTKNSLIGWITGGGSAEDDIDLQGSTLRVRARDLYAGGGLGRGAPATMVTNVVGWGIRPKPKIDAEALGMTEEAAEEWQAAALRDCNLPADGSDRTPSLP